VIRKRIILLAIVTTLTAVAWVMADRFYSRNTPWNYKPEIRDRDGTPTWDMGKTMPKDGFTFVRIQYPSRYRPMKWITDWPDADLNLSYRLQELTSLRVNPNPEMLELTDPRLADYPFIYIVEPGDMELEDEQVAALRKYLLNGGFLMVDDFWGGDEYDVFYENIKRVFPDRDVVDLDISHPVFHSVFDLKEKPHGPSIHHFMRGYTYESRPGPDDGSQVHYRSIFDDKGRMMVIICHNTDLGDGWEREGESKEYFEEYSVKGAYPMAVNIIFYAMTH
jgi:hypothetical protein